MDQRAVLEKMLRPAEVAEILGYRDLDRVRAIMREMIHMEKPLRVPVSALQTWINERTYTVSQRTGKTVTATGDRIPRRRGGKLQGVSA